MRTKGEDEAEQERVGEVSEGEELPVWAGEEADSSGVGARWGCVRCLQCRKHSLCDTRPCGAGRAPAVPGLGSPELLQGL